MPEGGQVYHYTLTDPKTGATFPATSTRELTADELARKSAAYFSKPLPNPNAPVEGVAPGSPLVNAGREALEIGVTSAASAAAPGLAAPLVGKLPQAAQIVGRMGAAAAGGMAGRAAITPLSQGRMTTTPEMLTEAMTSAVGEGISSAVIRNVSEAEKIGKALRKAAGVPEVPFTKGRVVSDIADLAEAEGASRMRLGQDIVAVLPRITKKIHQTERGLYETAERLADAEGIRIEIPQRAKDAASTIAYDLGDPATHPDPNSVARFKKLLERIANSGQEVRPNTLEVDVPIGGQSRVDRSTMKVGGFRPAEQPQRTSAEFLGGLLERTPGPVSGGLRSPTSGTLTGPNRTSAELFGGGGRTPAAVADRTPTRREVVTGRQSTTDLAGGKRPPPSLTFKEYNQFLREVRELGPNYKDRLMPGQFEDGVFKALGDELQAGLETAVRGTKAEDALVAAKRYHQETNVAFRDNVVNVLKNSDKGMKYSDVMDLVVKADNPEGVRELMRHLDPNLQQQMKQSWLNHHVIQKSIDQSTGLFDPKMALDGINKLSHETRRALFGSSSRDVEIIMENLANTVKRNEGVVGKGLIAGKFGIPISVGMFMLAQGNFQGALPALITGTAGVGAISYILSSRTLARWVARGIESPQGSKIARRAGQAVIHGLPGEFAQLMARPEETQVGPVPLIQLPSTSAP